MDEKCPQCGYDMMDEYEKALDGGDTKWVRTSGYFPYFDGEYNGIQWIVHCKCKKCKSEWEFYDSNI